MKKASGSITGENKKSSTYTYSDYTKTQADASKETWKTYLDKQYAYRAALEKKFGEDALKNNKKAIESLQKYEELLVKKFESDKAKRERENRKKALEELKSAGLLTNEQRSEYKQIRKDEVSERLQEKLVKEFSSIGSNIVNYVKSSLIRMENQVDRYIDVFNNYAAGINTRLQGTNKSFSSIADTITGKLAGSPLVKQTEVISKLNDLVDAGISYNVEQRAFLASVTDKVVTTFEVANSTLLRIIRLQQADSTIARMGMESVLNRYLNATYQDTSYLKDAYDTIESSLVDAVSQLSVQAGTEFEYVVQKWLGSLYSVGMDSGTLSSLARGINYIASGNVGALSQNTALQNLLLMGANRAGLDYGTMLQQGVSTIDLDKLLAGVVEYAQGLAQTDNLVVKNKYAELFGLTMADMTALLQMGDDLSYVINQTLSYSEAVQETRNQIATISQRMPLATMIKTAFDNVMATAAEGIATNTGAYITWLVTNVVEEATGGINIPFVNVLGSGVDVNANVTQLMKTGIMGYSLLSQISNIMDSLNVTSSDNYLYGWGETPYTARGSGFTGITTGVQATTSQSLLVGNASGSDIASNSIAAARSEAQQSVSGQESEDRDTVNEIRNNVSMMAQILQSVFDNNNSLRVRVLDYGLVNTSDSSRL